MQSTELFMLPDDLCNLPDVCGKDPDSDGVSGIRYQVLGAGCQVLGN